MSALPPIADIRRLVPELLLQQKQHAHGFYTRGPFSLLMCGSNYFSVARWIGSVPTRPTTLIVVIRAISRCTGRCGTCGSIVCAPIYSTIDTSDTPRCQRTPNSRIRSIRQPDDCRKTPVGYLQSTTKANDADKTSDGGLVARGSLAILLTIRRASSLLSNFAAERNRSKRILI